MTIILEAELIEVIDGIITKIKYADRIFVSMDRMICDNDKGKIVGYHGTQRVYEKPLDKAKEVIKNPNWESKDLVDALRPFYPKNKRASLDSKACVYKKYIEENKKCVIE